MALRKEGAGGADPDFTRRLADFHSLCERELSSSQERARVQSGGIDVSVQLDVADMSVPPNSLRSWPRNTCDPELLSAARSLTKLTKDMFKRFGSASAETDMH